MTLATLFLNIREFSIGKSNLDFTENFLPSQQIKDLAELEKDYWFTSFQELLSFDDSVEFAAKKPKAPKVGVKITQKSGRVITCNPGKTYPCGAVCRSQNKGCKTPIEGQAKTYIEWLELQNNQPKKSVQKPFDKKDKTQNTNGKNKKGEKDYSKLDVATLKQEKNKILDAQEAIENKYGDSARERKDWQKLEQEFEKVRDSIISKEKELKKAKETEKAIKATISSEDYILPKSELDNIDTFYSELFRTASRLKNTTEDDLVATVLGGELQLPPRLFGTAASLKKGDLSSIRDELAGESVISFYDFDTPLLNNISGKNLKETTQRLAKMLIQKGSEVAPDALEKYIAGVKQTEPDKLNSEKFSLIFQALGYEWNGTKWTK